MIRTLAASLLTLALAGEASATSTLYTDRAAWEAAVAGFSTETFDSIPDQAIPQYTGGAIVTPSFDIVVSSDVHVTGILGGVWYGDVHTFVEGFPGSNEFDFHDPIDAFGVDIVRVEDSLPLYFTIGGEHFIGAVGFFGIVSDTSFSSVRLELDCGCAPRFYRLDNVSFAPTPEPSTATACMLMAVLVMVRLWWKRMGPPGFEPGRVRL